MILCEILILCVKFSSRERLQIEMVLGVFMILLMTRFISTSFFLLARMVFIAVILHYLLYNIIFHINDKVNGNRHSVPLCFKDFKTRKHSLECFYGANQFTQPSFPEPPVSRGGFAVKIILVKLDQIVLRISSSRALIR